MKVSLHCFNNKFAQTEKRYAFKITADAPLGIICFYVKIDRRHRQRGLQPRKRRMQRSVCQSRLIGGFSSADTSFRLNAFYGNAVYKRGEQAFEKLKQLSSFPLVFLGFF